MRRLAPLLLLGALLVCAAGCAGSTAKGGDGPLEVVAAENFWGSSAAQLGGSKVHVTSVVTSPATDPHDYEPTAADGRLLAGGRIAIDVGDLVGIPAGGNPHRWYSPPSVQQVIDAIAGDYSKLDPKDAAFFRARKRAFETKGLAQYK